jgi:phosphatidylserine/phosphatidylglycerophosphate/cardiolipin synthase-like enzyme
MFNRLHLRVQKLARRGLPIDYITTNINMAGNENVAIMNERIRDELRRGKELEANWSLAKLIATNNYYGVPHYNNLMKDWMPIQNVHIWNHISFMHSKIFYFDRIVASVGSYNFQHNATDQAYESTAICMDETLNHELDKILVQDMANSIPLIFSRVR